MFHSIRWRIALPFVVLIVLVMSGLGIYVSNFTRQTYIDNLEAELKAEARLIADVLSARLANDTSADQIDPLARHWADLLRARVTIIAADGTVLGESQQDRKQMENHLLRPEVQQALHSGVGISMRYSQTVGYDMFYVAVPIKTSTGQPAGYARVALPMEQIQSNLAFLQRSILIVTIFATLLAVMMAAWIARRTTRPLIELTHMAAKVSAGQSGLPVYPASGNEINQLTEAFHRMAAELQRQIQALKSEQSKTSAVLEEMTDGVLIVNSQGEIELTNPAAEKIFQIATEQALGHTVAEVLRNHQLVEIWRQCRETEEPQATLLELGPKRVYLQVVAVPLGHTLPGSILLLVQNLTHIRQLETVRRDFISNISHELRTPLASLKAITETLQEGALEDTDVAHRFLDRMEVEVDSLSLMVQELLELSRIESGQVPLQLKPVRPREVIESAVDRLHLQAERAGLTVQVEAADDLSTVLADQVRVEQVLVNLLHNAIKFTPSGGRITVRAQDDQENIVFSVVDTGIGISSIDLPRIFERFFKSDRARSSGGTGLGLAIARHTVEAHGGKIWVSSREGEGSTFSFTILKVKT